MSLTPLSYALIGLALAEPRTGYALRKVFENTPLGIFSSSPGSIYPALRKLVAGGYLQVENEGDRHSVYGSTKAGVKVLEAWATAPVTLAEVARAMDVVMLRFAFQEKLGAPEKTVRFLESFQSVVGTHVDQLNAFLQSGEADDMSAHGRLAMENGIMGYETNLVWASKALSAFQRQRGVKG